MDMRFRLVKVSCLLADMEKSYGAQAAVSNASMMPA